ncbi:hypothetical protein FGO68_gene1688 [Halteria grandinella]|uniref:EF-hand domain-containing protein n=1 Tax=Halteria grandinella TaxID=5974 RepID=A0A8J8NS28_HALGN|nr:hypothetical protein FGO68_gene1688 [Halteria grandinella]
MEILQITIEVSEGQVETIIVREDDDPHIIAREFCIKHNLNEHVYELLYQQFSDKISTVKQQQHSQQASELDDFDDGEVNFDPDDNRPLVNHSQNHSRSQLPAPTNLQLGNGSPLKSHRIVHQRGSGSKAYQKYREAYNPGVRLYLKGLKKQEDKARMAEQARQQYEEQEKEKYTFKPQISNKSAKQRDMNVETYLLNYGKMITQKHELLRREYEEIQNLGFKYKPTINKTSELMVQHRQRIGEENVETSSVGDETTELSAPKDRFHQLYQQGVNKIARLQQLQALSIEQDCTFRPKLSTAQSARGRKDSVFERMYLHAQHQQHKSLIQQQEVAKNIDKNTGKALFRPQTGRSPYNRMRESLGEDIGSHLYDIHKQKTMKKQQIIEQQAEVIRQKSSTPRLVNNVSKYIVDLKINQNLSLIFDKLDANKQGVISGQNIEISGLSAELLQILKPLLQELDQFNETLDKEEFIDSALRLYKTLTVTQRNVILKYTSL